MQEYLISIIIPVYNTKIEYLEMCFKSLYMFSSENCEILVIDDGSNRKCAEYLDFISTKYSNMTVYHKDNKGVSATRNFGLDHSKGDYIIFVDSDDVIVPMWYIKAVESAQKNNYDMVIGRIQRCERNRINEIEEYEYDEKIFEDIHLMNVQRYFLLEDCSPVKYMSYVDHGQCGKIFKKSILTKLRFDERIKISEDQAFLHSVLRNCKRVLINNQLSYLYINNGESTSNTYMDNALVNEKLAMESIKLNLFQENMDAFYYRVVNDLRTAIILEVINNSTFSFFIAREKVKLLYTIEVYDSALKRVKLCMYKSYLNKIKIILLKKKLIVLYIGLKKLIQRYKIFRQKCGR